MRTRRECSGGANLRAMSDTPSKDGDAQRPAEPERDEAAHERGDRGIGDFVKRAVSAGFEAASRSKEDFVRVASTEIRTWLHHLDLDTELRKALSQMVLEVKAEIRFRPNDGSKLEPVATTDVKVKTEKSEP